MLFTILILCYSLNILAMLFGDAFACGYGELHIPLIISACVASLVAIANGYKWSFLEQGIIASINRSMQAMLILLVVGLLIGSWIAAGVVPAMIYYGLMILSPGVFLAAACIMCCIVSLATGSSWTTAGTVGIALVGVGQGLGVDLAMTAGAIVSGAYFGDKMSPLSDTTNLAPAVAGSTLFNHVRHMVYTVTPSLLIALILYAILGMGQSKSSNVNMSTVQTIMDGMTDNFNISPLLLIPPVVVIIIVALKLPAIPGLLGGVLLGCIMGSLMQGVALADWFGIVHYGYVSETGIESIDTLLSRGGMDSFLWTVNLIICAMCFGGVMDASGMLATLAEALLKVVKGTGSLVTVTIFSCIFMNIIAADQYLSIILPGRMYKEAFEDRHLDNRNLSRCLEDAGTLTSCLVPWNTCGATMTTLLGVAPWGHGGGYGRYAFLNLINPVVSIIYGFTGFTMMKMTDEQYAKVMEEREATRLEALKVLEA
ncbi:Na+/H+ antiporter NhaC [Clostridium aminobutyricum]|uniref:Na+/H+ antiporter NhaC n=2 Tax=Clostridium aminobutyricum TaxID=33953 RepID=A0A939DA48_CLOAM|nr:Na+/H+ antiporter NhaC [Clostridium aminobutyricum]